MTQDDIHTCSYSCQRPACIKAQRDELVQKLPKLVAEAVAAEREKVAAWMRARSYATGHGDTVEDLLKELEWQVAEREREALGDIILDYAERDDLSDSDESLLKHLFELIRARGET